MDDFEESDPSGESVSVIRVRDRLQINLSRPDLGHPNLPRLWEEIHYGNTRSGELVCGLGHAMSVRQLGDGTRWAYHLVKSDGETHGVSDEHKAMAEWLYQNAERQGFRAEVERTSDSRRFRSDVRIEGANGIRIGGEIQYSPAGASDLTQRSGMVRTNKMLREGVTPLWLAPSSNAANIRDRLPSAVFGDLPLEVIRPDNRIQIISGPVKSIVDDHWVTPQDCPRLKGGYCTGKHVRLAATGFDLADMVFRVATGNLVIIRRPVRRIDGVRTTALYYVSPSDRDVFIENGGILESVVSGVDQKIRTLADAVLQGARAFTLDCSREDLKPVVQPSPVWVPSPQAYRPKQGICAYADRDGCGDRPARRFMSGWRCDRHE